jgi:hypothetical protein
MATAPTGIKLKITESIKFVKTTSQILTITFILELTEMCSNGNVEEDFLEDENNVFERENFGGPTLTLALS